MRRPLALARRTKWKSSKPLGGLKPPSFAKFYLKAGWPFDHVSKTGHEAEGECVDTKANRRPVYPSPVQSAVSDEGRPSAAVG